MLLSIGYLLVTKSCTWRTEINDTKIRNLKIENWCMHLCVVLSFDISNIDYIRCTWLKYQRFMPTEIKTTLKLRHTIYIQPRSVVTIWTLVLPRQLIHFVDLDIYILKMLRLCFCLKLKMSNWKNTARLLCEIVHMLIYSVASCIRLHNRVFGK